MKMKSLCLAMALVGLTSHYASAADGTLYFSGTIVNSTCKLASGNNDGLIEVKMGAVPLSKLKNDTNGTGPEVGVNISVKDCDEGTYYIVLDGASATEAPITNVLALDAGNLTAKEVAIKWSAAPDMTPQTVLYRRPVAQFSNFQPKIVSSWLILALFQANF
ncbi:fimbrial protein, partial [Klebsiella pneumoniae]